MKQAEAKGNTQHQENLISYSFPSHCPLQAAKLKARLMLMEGWLQRSDCGSPWGPLDILQGEAPLVDVYQGHHLLQGTEDGTLGGEGTGRGEGTISG